MFGHLIRKLKSESGKFDWMWGTTEIRDAILGKNESQMEGFKLPEYYEDPDYRKAQDYLSTLGTDILGGNIPDYYKAIGETGSNEFENYLRMLEGDVSKNVMEGAAAIGRGRGGLVPATIGAEVGKLSTEARYNDYVRALTGKQWLFTQGKDITESVRSAGQQEGANKNTFNLNTSKLDYNKRSYLDEFNLGESARQGEATGDLLSMGMGAFFGGATGGATGAVSGAMGGVDWSEIFDRAAGLPSKTKTAKQLGKIYVTDL